MNQTLKNTTRISANLPVTGRLTSKGIQQGAEDGFQSILDLRSPGNNNELMSEKNWALSARLNYISLPVQAALLNDELIYDLFLQINQLPKPLLIHCSSDLTESDSWPANAYTITLMYIATQEGLTLDQALHRAAIDGFYYSKDPALKKILSLHIDTYSVLH